MKQFYEVPYPEMRTLCPSSSHYVNLIVDGICFTCGAVWGLSTNSYHDDVVAAVKSQLETERTVDAIVGVGDAPSHEE